MVNMRHDEDADPTGIRALLSSLPDPGPMPAELATRIAAAIEAERRALADGSVHPFAPPQRQSRLRWVRYAAVAASALVVAGGVGIWVNHSGTDSSSTTAAASSVGSNLAVAGGTAPQTDSSGREEAAKDRSAANTAPIDIQFAASGVAYTTAGFATQVRSLSAVRSQQLPALASESPGLGPITTPIGARDCASALGIPTDRPLLVEVATFDGKPAVVLLARGPEGGATAYAVARSCPAGDFLLAGPVTVPPGG